MTLRQRRAVALEKVRGTVAVHTHGKIYTAIYMRAGDTVTVVTPNGNLKAWQVRDRQFVEAAEAALLELVREGKAG